MFKSFIINGSQLFNIYIVLWEIYYFQDLLHIPRVLSLMLLVILLGVSLYFFYLCNSRYKLPVALKFLTVIIIVFTFYGLYRIAEGESYYISEIGMGAMVRPIVYLRNIYISLLPIYTVYVATRMGLVRLSAIKIWTIVFLLLSIVEFYHYHDVMLTKSTTNNSEITNNASYGVVAIILFLPFFSKRPLFDYIILFICLYYALIGMKRGALVCAALITITFFVSNLRGTKKLWQKILVFILVLIVTSSIVVVVDRLLEGSDYFNSRVERTMEGYSSHRDEIYTDLFNHFINEDNAMHFLFGNGADATLKISKNYAHNDWLEMVINNGLIMIILYAFFWLTLLYYTIKSRKINFMCYQVLLMFWLFSFTRTLFSMGYSNMSIQTCVAFGFALAMIDNQMENLPVKRR